MSQDLWFERLRHPNPNLRDQATVEIVENRNEQTIDRLMAALDDSDTTYRRAAVKALGLVGFDALPALVEAMLTSDNVTVRGSAAKALAQIAICYPDDEFPALGLEALGQALNDDNPVVHIGAAMALGQIGEPSVDILADTLKATDNIALQVSILNAMASVGGDRAAAVLQAAETDETLDPYVKETATSAVSRLQFVKKNSWSS